LICVPTNAGAQPLRRTTRFSRLAMRSILAFAIGLLLLGLPAVAQKKDEKKEDKKKPAETLKIERVTQGMGLYALGPISPDRKSLLLLAQKPNQPPNLYVMNVTDRSIRPALTSFQWGVADPGWSPDGQTVALAGFGESGSFAEIYLLDMKTGKLRQMTKNNFSDKEPVFTPD